MTQKGWNVPAGRPEYTTEEYRNENIKNNLRSEPFCNHLQDLHTDLANDMVTGDNESPILQFWFLSFSRDECHQENISINLTTISTLSLKTIPAQEIATLVAEKDSINRLADVLTSMQNRPTAQQLTIRPVNSNTMTFDGKSEMFELFEDLFHTIVKMQPEMSEQI